MAKTAVISQNKDILFSWKLHYSQTSCRYFFDITYITKTTTYCAPLCDTRHMAKMVVIEQDSVQYDIYSAKNSFTHSQTGCCAFFDGTYHSQILPSSFLININ